QEVIGGEVVTPDMGCGVVSSGSSLYFSKAGLRQLVSWDLDTEWAEFVQFYLRVGGDWAECNQADSREEGVLLQYSNDGGISWGLIAEMYFTDFTKPRFVHYELPLASKTPSTRFRWWQPLHSGEGYDQWAIDDIGGGCGIIGEGKALYFSSPGRREARTVPLDTTNTRSKQDLNVSKNVAFLVVIGVIVQFSTNNGVEWQFLRELDFSSFLEPQVVTIELPPPAKTPYTVFRWWQPQQGKHSAQWALDDVLIGMNDSSRTGFHDKFDGTTPLRHNWYRIQGGEVTVDCLSLDTALTFNSEAIDSESHHTHICNKSSSACRETSSYETTGCN
uniref:Reelin n=1 Tax=Salarias fasciatus TaxID=181472 RepID=A0A672ID98_SALFA